MAFCAKCGTKLNDAVAFCPSWGASTGRSPSAPPPPPPFEPAPSASYAYAGTAPSLFSRVQNILMKPKNEWPVIERESATVSSLYTGYIMLLAAIPAITSFIVMSLIGSAVAIIARFRVPMYLGLTSAIVSYILSLAAVYLSAFIIDKLAPSFQSQSNQIQALKLVAYAYTAAWVAGIANIVPILGFLVVLAGGLYSVYLFYVGLPVMMKTPSDKVIPYIVTSVVIIFVLMFIISMIVGSITAASLIGTRMMSF
jgi:Yip1 domain